MSKLLIPEQPLMILPKLARQIGLNEAIVLQQLHYWLLTSPIEREEKKWVYNSYQDWHDQFPFWSVSTIGRIFRKLEELKLIITKQFNVEGWNQTKWYTINYQNGMIDDAKTAHSNVPKENTLYKENKKETNKKGDLLDGMIALSGKRDKLEQWPVRHAELARPFCEFYRYPYKEEVKAWIAQVDIWVGRHYTVKDVRKAIEYIVEKEWEYVQPASILKAFGKDTSPKEDDYSTRERL